MINTIVVGTDGSKHGQHAVTWAAEFARQLGAEVVLVHAAPPLASPIVGAGGYVMYVPQDVLDQTRADLEERVLIEFCAPLRAAGVAWQSRLLEGSAPIVLGDVATEVGAQLIVVGTRALHAFGELLHGSTSHGLTLHTDVPVVVVPLSAHVTGGSSVAARPQAAR
jgi:nucleotide-binding universal stress UspA family protein